ncbi:MAG: protein translocase subunit SecF [Gammaproteobacteria bacterium]|nr:protein translocase subunit SecF [Gammaproteobacteria bacterium]MBU1655819.1 protein translocase subunit SecF [Gammaproteobacteria bacterium]MBU1962399.1 protein translocase subunit SecF [Gammaproteobacteria bacterium]
MELISSNLNIRFLRASKLALVLSVVAILASVAALLTRGLNFGIDFTGGTLVEVGYTESVELDKVRKDLAAGGFSDAVVQHFGSARDVLIRLPPSATQGDQKLADKVFQGLSAGGTQLELRRVEFVGPQVGSELAEDGGLALLYTLIGILVYVGFRFEYRFSLGAVLALVHDVIITLGCFSLLWYEFDLPALAAVLAVIGYSLNDTIVVFDRIRENFRRMRKGSPEEITERSLNETLSRTIITSLATFLVVLALALFGGKVIFSFAMVLIIGILIGTYSSIYVASALALALGVSKDDLMPVQKEGAGTDNRP